MTSELDRINEGFHQSYDRASEDAQSSVPVLVFLGDALVLHRRGRREERTVTSAPYLALRSAAHAPLALFSLLVRHTSGGLGEETLAGLHALRENLSRALARLEHELTDEPARRDTRALLEEVTRWLERCLASQHHDADALAALARACGPRLLRLTDHATRLQLATLHGAASELLAPLREDELAQLQVVVAGAHQARDRSLGMQYFRKRLREPEHEEDRVAYAENAPDEAAALALVGKRKLDGDVATAFFADPKRLQRDVLGDAVATQLEAFDLG